MRMSQYEPKRASGAGVTYILGDEEFLEEQVAMMMQFGSPYLGLVNRE